MLRTIPFAAQILYFLLVVLNSNDLTELWTHGWKSSAFANRLAANQSWSPLFHKVSLTVIHNYNSIMKRNKAKKGLSNLFNLCSTQRENCDQPRLLCKFFFKSILVVHSILQRLLCQSYLSFHWKDYQLDCPSFAIEDCGHSPSHQFTFLNDWLWQSSSIQTNTMLQEEHVWFGATVAQKIFPYLLWLHFLHVTALAITAF